MNNQCTDKNTAISAGNTLYPKQTVQQKVPFYQQRVHLLSKSASNKSTRGLLTKNTGRGKKEHGKTKLVGRWASKVLAEITTVPEAQPASKTSDLSESASSNKFSQGLLTKTTGNKKVERGRSVSNGRDEEDRYSSVVGRDSSKSASSNKSGKRVPLKLTSRGSLTKKNAWDKKTDRGKTTLLAPKVAAVPKVTPAVVEKTMTAS